MIDIKHKVLFIHIPRTGGSNFCDIYHDYMYSDCSIDKFTYDRYMVGIESVLKHIAYKDYEAIYYNDKLHTYNQICIIRNIYDLIVSVYFQTIHNNRNCKTFFHRWCKSNTKDITFQSWVDCISSFIDAPEKNKNTFSASPYIIVKQSGYLTGCSDSCTIIDFTQYDQQIAEWYKTSFNLDVDIQKSSDSMLESQYSKANYPVHRPVDYREMYNNHLLDQVTELYADEIDIFGFKFERNE